MNLGTQQKHYSAMGVQIHDLQEYLQLYSHVPPLVELLACLLACLLYWTSNLEVGSLSIVSAIVLFPWTINFIPHFLDLFTSVYKWVPTFIMLGGNLAMDKQPIQGGVAIFPVTSCYMYRNWS